MGGFFCAHTPDRARRGRTAPITARAHSSPVQAVAPYPYSRPVGGLNEEGELSAKLTEGLELSAS